MLAAGISPDRLELMARGIPGPQRLLAPDLLLGAFLLDQRIQIIGRGGGGGWGLYTCCRINGKFFKHLPVEEFDINKVNNALCHNSNGPGATWANEMNFVRNHAPGAGSIARFVGQQSSALPLRYGRPRNACKHIHYAI